jgi:hypothetical protein
LITTLPRKICTKKLIILSRIPFTGAIILLAIFLRVSNLFSNFDSAVSLFSLSFFFLSNSASFCLVLFWFVKLSRIEFKESFMVTKEFSKDLDSSFFRVSGLYKEDSGLLIIAETPVPPRRALGTKSSVFLTPKLSAVILVFLIFIFSFVS